MTFEIHLTTETLAEDKIPKFVKACNDLDCKPILIALARGQHSQQPMASAYWEGDFEGIKTRLINLGKELSNRGFSTYRYKIEVDPREWKKEAAVCYYEWHAKVQIEVSIPSQLLAICKKHHAHLSKNSLKNETGKRFITARSYQPSFKVAKEKFENLEKDLKEHKIPIIKTITEACIFDSNEQLDAGWLTPKTATND